MRALSSSWGDCSSFDSSVPSFTSDSDFFWFYKTLSSVIRCFSSASFCFLNCFSVAFSAALCLSLASLSFFAWSLVAFSASLSLAYWSAEALSTARCYSLASCRLLIWIVSASFTILYFSSASLCFFFWASSFFAAYSIWSSYLSSAYSSWCAFTGDLGLYTCCSRSFLASDLSLLGLLCGLTLSPPWSTFSFFSDYSLSFLCLLYLCRLEGEADWSALLASVCTSGYFGSTAGFFTWYVCYSCYFREGTGSAIFAGWGVSFFTSIGADFWGGGFYSIFGSGVAAALSSAFYCFFALGFLRSPDCCVSRTSCLTSSTT